MNWNLSKSFWKHVVMFLQVTGLFIKMEGYSTITFPRPTSSLLTTQKVGVGRCGQVLTDEHHLRQRGRYLFLLNPKFVTLYSFHLTIAPFVYIFGSQVKTRLPIELCSKYGCWKACRMSIDD